MMRELARGFVRRNDPATQVSYSAAEARCVQHAAPRPRAGRTLEDVVICMRSVPTRARP